MNHLAPEDKGYRHEPQSVSSLVMTTDESRAEANGSITAAQRRIREMNDPSVGSLYYGISTASKLMLQSALEGETTKMAAKRLGVSSRQALRLMKAAEKEAQEITQSLVLHTVQACSKEDNVLPWPSDETFEIQACAAPAENKLVELVEAFDCALTVPQLAKILQCSKRQIYELVQDKRLPAIKIGISIRLDPASVSAWIRNRMTIAA